MLKVLSRKGWIVSRSVDGTLLEVSHWGTENVPGVLYRLHLIKPEQVKDNGVKAPRFALEEYCSKRVGQKPKDVFIGSGGRPFDCVGPRYFERLLLEWQSEFENGG